MVSTVWTIGHSTRPIEMFVSLLAIHGLQTIADVRRFPGSRRQPQYGQLALDATLSAHGLQYRWLPLLGGRRRPMPDSKNVAWRNASFRGYADHIRTAEFARGLAELLELAAAARTAVMCAELVWWRCHRALIADVLHVRGIEVIHILDGGKTVVHPLTSAARVIDGQLTYAR